MIHRSIGRALSGIVLVALAIALSACVVETDTYLSEPGAEPLDARLEGAWRLLDADSDGLGILMLAEDETGAFAMLSLEVDEDPQTGKQTFKWNASRAWTSDVAGEGYFNVEIEGEKMVVAYRILDDGDVAAGLMDEDRFSQAIESGKLPGTVTPGTFGGTIRITADAKTLAKFLEENGGHALFDFGDANGHLLFERYTFPVPEKL
jgi:hypothetical protein